jgi:hypothetical protein
MLAPTFRSNGWRAGGKVRGACAGPTMMSFGQTIRPIRSALEQLRANTDTRWSPLADDDAEDEQQAALAALEAIADSWSKAMPAGPPQLISQSG